MLVAVRYCMLRSVHTLASACHEHYGLAIMDLKCTLPCEGLRLALRMCALIAARTSDETLECAEVAFICWHLQ